MRADACRTRHVTGSVAGGGEAAESRDIARVVYYLIRCRICYAYACFAATGAPTLLCAARKRTYNACCLCQPALACSAFLVWRCFSVSRLRCFCYAADMRADAYIHDDDLSAPPFLPPCPPCRERSAAAHAGVICAAIAHDALYAIRQCRRDLFSPLLLCCAPYTPL